MDTSEIISTLANCNHAELTQIRVAIDARVAEIRTALMAQAAEMGLACSDDGAPKKRRKNSKHAGAS
jgi:hypothetical protein